MRLIVSPPESNSLIESLLMMTSKNSVISVSESFKMVIVNNGDLAEILEYVKTAASTFS
jgi:hypothetical protein